MQIVYFIILIIILQPLLKESHNGTILGYNIYYRSTPPAGYHYLTGGVYNDNGTNVTIANYSLTVFRPGNVDATSYQYTLDGLNDDDSYDFYMEAFNSVGDIQFSWCWYIIMNVAIL